MAALPPHRPPRGEPLRCPLDGSRLVELERTDVLIDACPECRGVWLDRGELDRSLERRGPVAPQPPPPPRHAGERHRDDDHDQYRKRKRRKSMLEELFDFG